MNRTEFFKTACTLGVCSCFGVRLFGQNEEPKETEETPEVKKLTKKLDFVQRRFAQLNTILNAHLSEDAKKKILEELGRTCAKDYISFAEKYKGNLDGFLKAIQEEWGEQVEYDKNNQTIKIVGQKQTNCFCPFAKTGVTPIDFCNCSIGWQKENYETILGKPVSVTINESILRGGERCSFTIKAS
jgi:hypothetical protein